MTTTSHGWVARHCSAWWCKVPDMCSHHQVWCEWEIQLDQDAGNRKQWLYAFTGIEQPLSTWDILNPPEEMGTSMCAHNKVSWLIGCCQRTLWWCVTVSLTTYTKTWMLTLDVLSLQAAISMGYKSNNSKNQGTGGVAPGSNMPNLYAPTIPSFFEHHWSHPKTAPYPANQ